MRRVPALVSCLSLAACSTVGDTFRMTGIGVGDAVTAPLKDLNLVRVKVPAVLREAAKDAYRRPARTDCAYLAHEIAQLDLALGPDLDVPRGAERTSLATRGSVAASDAALDAVRDFTTGWMPFRSVVRRLTGAAGDQDAMEDAVHAGGVRRAYLKGLGLQQNCPHPAAPLPGLEIATAAPAPVVEEGSADPAEDAAPPEPVEDTRAQPVASVADPAT